MESSKFVREEEEEWSNNETGWTKFFESYGNEFGSAGCHIKENNGGSEIVEDDDSLASDASSGPAYYDQSCNIRSEDSEVKGHAKCWFDDDVKEGHERQKQEKKKLCNEDAKHVKDKAKRRSFFKL